MARTVDADDLKKVIESFAGMLSPVAGFLIRQDAVIMAIEHAPTIDPVVRCKDCAIPHNKWTGCPKLLGRIPPDDFYCADGVRKDGILDG